MKIITAYDVWKSVHDKCMKFQYEGRGIPIHGVTQGSHQRENHLTHEAKV